MGFLSRLFRTESTNYTNLDATTLHADWIIIGLGNPGAKYAATRHNVGFMALDDLLAREGEVFEPLTGFKAHGALVIIGERKVLAVRPHTYMNLSGEAIEPLARTLGIPANRIICLHDELDLPANTIRIKQGGNENGHNGLKSLSESLGTRDYFRVRIGISRPPKGSPIPEYVLGPVDAGPDFDTAISTAARAARLIVTDGLAKAQNTIHSA